MEDTLREYMTMLKYMEMRLNPCFNGKYSQSLSSICNENLKQEKS